MKKVVVSGYYGFKNSGDDAILSSICADLRAISKEIAVTILSNTPEEVPAEYGFPAVHRFRFWPVVKALKACDLLLMGGGSLLQDGTSSRSLYYYLGLIWLAKLFGAKVILYANGIGPVHRRRNQWLTRMIVNQVDTITLREHLSLEVLSKLKITRPKIAVTADPVFNLKLDHSISKEKIYQQEGIVAGKPIVGVMFRSWQQEEAYVKKMSNLCDWLIDKYDVQIVFVPMRFPADIRIAEDMQAKMKHPAVVIRNYYTSQEIIALIADMKLVLSMRLHALIYAAIQNVPMMGFNYDPKVLYYVRELDIECVNHMHHIRLDEIEGSIDEMMKCPEKYQAKIMENTLRLKKEAKENRGYLQELLV
ncbi:polysaccharide pyruvyl transferase CsaB [Clostridiales bacterium COT073_COT-073]|nr:polysaccharide pyruvyl transferase CsaB [Clostridiales bacterium COT073_COT-073]